LRYSNYLKDLLYYNINKSRKWEWKIKEEYEKWYD